MSEPSFRLCYITASDIPSSKAHSVQVMKMCAALAAHGVQTELIIAARSPATSRRCPEQPDIWAWYGVPKSFRVTRLPYPNLGSTINRRTSKLAYPLMAALHAALRRPDLVYTRKLWVAYWLARWHRPVVLEAHDGLHGPQHVGFHRLRDMSKHNTSLRGIVTVSQGAADLFTAAGIPADRLRVLRDGVDLAPFDAPLAQALARAHLGLPADRPIVGYVGNLHPGQGTELLLECARLSPEALFLLVGGEPEEVAEHRSRSATDRIQNVWFAGAQPHAVIPTYLYAADVLAMPYTSRVPHIQSISPMKMFEYMAALRPIVSSDFPAIREVLTHERNAILVEPDRPDALLAGLRRVLGDQTLAARIAGQARQDVEPYTWSNRAAKIIEWFAQDALPRPA